MAFERVISSSNVSAQESAIIMHQSRENIELVLQEVCVQHRSVDTMRREVVKISPHSSDENKKMIVSDTETTVTSEKPIVIEPLKTR